MTNCPAPLLDAEVAPVASQVGFRREPSEVAHLFAFLKILERTGRRLARLRGQEPLRGLEAGTAEELDVEVGVNPTTVS